MDITFIKTTPQSIIKLSVTEESHLTCEVTSITLFTLELFGQGLICWSCQLNSYDNYIVWGELVDTYHVTSELPILSLYFILVTLFVNNYCLVYYFNEMVVIDVTSKRIFKYKYLYCCLINIRGFKRKCRYILDCLFDEEKTVLLRTYNQYRYSLKKL